MEIVVNNSTSRLIAPRDALQVVRHHVAYMMSDLPSLSAQGVIKAFFAGKRSWGSSADVDRLWDDPETASRLESYGCDRRYLTAAMVHQIRRPGLWDGWRRMVSSDGSFSTGLLGSVWRAVRLRVGVEPVLVDERVRPRLPGPVAPAPSLYEFQQEAVDAWIRDCRGVVELPPRSGKTRIAIATLIRLGLPTLYVVPTVGLVTQTVEAFREWLPASQVVGVTGGAPSAKMRRVMNQAMVWVCTPPTAAGSKPKSGRRLGIEGISSRRVLVCDETHHSAADSWSEISLAAVNAYYRFGMTGTHFRADGADMAMRAVLSHTSYKRTVGDMVRLGRLVPAVVAMVRVPGWLDVSGRDAYREGVANYLPRDLLAMSAANELAAQGRRVLVLTKEVEHAKRLAAGIHGSVQVDGSDNSVVKPALDALEAGRIKAVVGTSVIGEGRDVPGADALVYPAGKRSRVQVRQDTFRPLTASPGKRSAIIIDFADNHHANLLEGAADRLAIYREDDAFTATVIDPHELANWIRAACRDAGSR